MIARTLEKDFLFDLQRQYPKDEIRLPGFEEERYKINLATRTIDSPEFLSIEKDHNSEVKYFVLDRYLDHKDLSTTTCIIQYENAAGEHFVYPVPFFDTYTLRQENKMIIPWNISGSVSAYAGEIKYSFRFFEFGRDENNQLTTELVYNLNTLQATSKILHGLDINIEQDDQYVVNYQNEIYYQLISMIQDPEQKIIYWNVIQ